MICLTEEEIAKIIGCAMANGGDFADIYITKSATGTILAEENKMAQFYRGYDMGCGIRVMKDNAATYLYSGDCSYSSLLSLAEKAAKATKPGCFSGDIVLEPKTNFGVKKDAFDLEIVGTMIKRINEDANKMNPLVKQVVLGYGDGNKEMLLANSEGRLVSSFSMRKRFFVKVVVEKNGELQSAMSTLGDTANTFLWTEDLFMKKTKEAMDRALGLLDAKEAPSGPATVILSSLAGGTMVHEACGHGLEADHIEKGLSVYENKIGTSVASEKITVIDDATIPQCYGSFAVDDEGTPGQKNILIEKGILKSYLYDIRTAKKMAMTSTGNGRRESYQCLPQVRMSNTYIAPGDDDPKAILADTKKGLFVKRMGGGQVNTNNGDFVFEVSEGYLIENGTLTYPVRNATLIGNGPKTLSSVFAVGNDLGFAIGTCGKGGQSVPVGDAQPTLGLSEVVVGGRG